MVRLNTFIALLSCSIPPARPRRRNFHHASSRRSCSPAATPRPHQHRRRRCHVHPRHDAARLGTQVPLDLESARQLMTSAACQASSPSTSTLASMYQARNLRRRLSARVAFEMLSSKPPTPATRWRCSTWPWKAERRLAPPKMWTAPRRYRKNRRCRPARRRQRRHRRTVCSPTCTF